MADAPWPDPRLKWLTVEHHFRDTTPKARRFYFECLRKMTPSQRVSQGMRLSRQMRELSEAGIRARHPDFSQDEVRRELFRLLHGDELCRRVYAASD